MAIPIEDRPRVASASVINLFSDTQTLPSEGMRAAMASAHVGDEQRFEDPTTRALEQRVAELLGHEAAVFLPSRDDVQPDRAAAARSARRRRGARRRRCPPAEVRERLAGRGRFNLTCMKFHWQLDPQLSGAIAKAIRPLAPGNAACAGVAGGGDRPDRDGGDTDGEPSVVGVAWGVVNTNRVSKQDVREIR